MHITSRYTWSCQLELTEHVNPNNAEFTQRGEFGGFVYYYIFYIAENAFPNGEGATGEADTSKQRRYDLETDSD